MMLDSPHTLAPMLMRGKTPPTTRSPPHRSRPTGYLPNRQPATVGEEELGGRGTTSRRTSMRAGGPRLQAATDRAAHVAAPHQHQQPLSTFATHPSTHSYIIAARIGYIPSQKSAKPNAQQGRVFEADRGPHRCGPASGRYSATPLAAGIPPRKGIQTSTVGCYVD